MKILMEILRGSKCFMALVDVLIGPFNTVLLAVVGAKWL